MLSELWCPRTVGMLNSPAAELLQDGVPLSPSDLDLGESLVLVVIIRGILVLKLRQICSLECICTPNEKKYL